MTEQNTHNIKKWSRVKLVIAGLLSFVVLLIALIAAGVYFLPQIIESRAKEFVAEKFNRELTVQKLDIDLLNLTAKLDGLVLTDPGSKVPFASFDHLFVELSPETFSERAPVVKEIRLVNPVIHVVRYGKKQYNINDLVAYAAQPKEVESKTNFSINNIRIDNGTVRIDDEQRKKTLLIDLNATDSDDASLSAYVMGNTTELKLQQMNDYLDTVKRNLKQEQGFDLVGNEKFKELLDRFSKQYEYILVNGRDVSAISEGYQTALLCDSNLVICGRRNVRTEELYMLKNTAEINHIHLDGVLVYDL